MGAWSWALFLVSHQGDLVTRASLFHQTLGGKVTAFTNE